MSEELTFILAIGAIQFTALLFSTVLETLFLKRNAWVSTEKANKYPLVANIFAQLIGLIFLGVVTALFLVLFATTLGGVWLLSAGSFLLTAFSFLAALAAMFGTRLWAARLTGVEKSQLSWKYAAVLTIITVVWLFVFLAGVLMFLSLLSSGSAIFA